MTDSVRIGNIQLSISESDMLFTASDVLICPCFDFKNHDNGICRQIKIRAGEDLMSELSKKKHQTCLTKSYRLAMRRIKNIIHMNNEDHSHHYDSMKKALTEAFQIANEKQFRTIVLGSLNASVYKISYETISKLILAVIEEFSLTVSHPVSVLIVDSNKNFLTIFEEKLHAEFKKNILL